MDGQQAIESFLVDSQSEKNLSDRTLRAYQSDLVQFKSHLEGENVVDVTSTDLEQYVQKLGTGDYRDTSIRRKVAALKVFFRYLEEKGVVDESPARKLKIKRPVEARVPVVLSPRELSLLLEAPKKQVHLLETKRDQSVGANNRYFCAVRDDVILDMLFSTGIRIGELVALDIADVDLSLRQLRITGRGTRSRHIPIPSEALLTSLTHYIELRRAREIETPALFVGRSGTRLTIYSIENVFKKHVRLAQIKRHITPHALRHTMASMLINSGADIRDVQEMLGHASILSTQVYTRLQPKKRTAAEAGGEGVVSDSGSSSRIPIRKK